jgi:hypothetical protein
MSVTGQAKEHKEKQDYVCTERNGDIIFAGFCASPNTGVFPGGMGLVQLHTPNRQTKLSTDLRDTCCKSRN